MDEQQKQDAAPEPPAPESESPPAEPNGPFLSLDDAVKLLNTSKPTLYRLLRQGDVKALKTGRQWRFRRADLVAYMARDTIVASAPSEDVDAELRFLEGQRPARAEEASRAEPGPDEEAVVPLERDLSDPGEQKIARLANGLIVHALTARASDIHLEPARQERETFLRCRIRMDGLLHEIRHMPISLHEPLIQRLKFMAEMNLQEKRIPQDGRIPIRCDGKDYDIRMAVIPTIHGEAVTMRILDRTSVLIGLDKLGFYPEDLARVQEILHRPKGLIITSGPTGSGKSTLLYSCLQELSGEGCKTLSIEDPVEYQLPYVAQTAVNRKVGLTFATGLRSILRQDPDVIMVGEVRDLETAEIAIEAALTGHAVLTCLHTDTAAEAVQRLFDIGVEPFLVSQTLTCVIAQRLIRRICANCREPHEFPAAAHNLVRLRERAFVGGYEMPENAVFYHGRGCEECRHTGYRGRMGLFEVMPIHPAMTGAILRRASAEELMQFAHGISPVTRSLVADGARKAVDGLTTVDEVLRVAPANA